MARPILIGTPHVPEILAYAWRITTQQGKLVQGSWHDMAMQQQPRVVDHCPVQVKEVAPEKDHRAQWGLTAAVGTRRDIQSKVHIWAMMARGILIKGVLRTLII